MNAPKPKGRSLEELRAIVYAEDARRADLLAAWGELTEDAQVEVVLLARQRLAEILADEA